jgi:hypothetical protein
MPTKFTDAPIEAPLVYEPLIPAVQEGRPILADRAGRPDYTGAIAKCVDVGGSLKQPALGLPETDEGRKALPVFTGVLMYFPDAIAAVADVSKKGNDQHNPGQPLHWARGKSTDQLNTALRHMMDHGRGKLYDSDGTLHCAKAAWRALAECQTTLERIARGEIK